MVWRTVLGLERVLYIELLCHTHYFFSSVTTTPHWCHLMACPQLGHDGLSSNWCQPRNGDCPLHVVLVLVQFQIRLATIFPTFTFACPSSSGTAVSRFFGLGETVVGSLITIESIREGNCDILFFVYRFACVNNRNQITLGMPDSNLSNTTRPFFDTSNELVHLFSHQRTIHCVPWSHERWIDYITITVNASPHFSRYPQRHGGFPFPLTHESGMTLPLTGKTSKEISHII